MSVNVVRNLEAGHFAALRAQSHESEHIFGLGANRAAELLHFQRKLRFCLRNAVLDLYHVHIAVGLDFEGKREVVVAVVRTATNHVQHVINAVDLVFDRHGNGVQHFLGACSRIGVYHLNRRRRKSRILRYGQLPDCHRACESKDDCNDHCESRTLDERSRKRLDLVD